MCLEVLIGIGNAPSLVFRAIVGVPPFENIVGIPFACQNAFVYVFCIKLDAVYLDR